MVRQRWPRELGAFLRARRAAVPPSAVEVAATGDRRVPGLRREEVALLASISPDYYTRIEQGRIPVSEPVLAALARALRLTDEEHAYATSLAGLDAPPAPPASRVVPATLRRLLDELVLSPAMVVGPGTELLAWNRQATALFTDFAALPPARRFMVGLVFLDPAVRGLYPDWSAVAEDCVAQLRYDSTSHPRDAALLALVADLSARDADFRRWWGEHRAARLRTGTKRFRHPGVGALSLDWDTLVDPLDPDLHLVTLTAEPGSDSAEALRRLADQPARCARKNGAR